VLLLAGFILRERRAPEPILPLRLFRDRAFVVISTALFISTLSLLTAIVFLPIFLQLVDGADATQSGLLTLPLLASSAVSTTVSGAVVTASGRYKIFPIIDLGLMSLGLLLLSTLTATSSRVAAAGYMVVFGAGFGMVTQILVVAIQNAVGPREIGTATASANLFRALGGAVGVAVYGAVFTSGLRHWLPIELAGRAARGITATGIQASRGRVHSLTPALHHGVAHAVGHSLHAVFLIAGPIALAGLLIVTLLPERPLRGRERTPAQPATQHDRARQPEQTAA
jgi:predicted MFS family arabinose efflux permease